MNENKQRIDKPLVIIGFILTGLASMNIVLMVIHLDTIQQYEMVLIMIGVGIMFVIGNFAISRGTRFT